MALTVKVFYEKPDGNKEIRRFPLKTSEDGDLFNMASIKIRSLFPDLNNGDFQLFWQDSDGDRIVLSCMEEMQEALSYVQDGVLRIYVSGLCDQSQQSQPEDNSKPGFSSAKPKQQSQEQKTKGQNGGPATNRPLHQGVICDGCEGLIYGIRYKCCICPDYDLCETCEGKGMHHEHDMFKITTPLFPMASELPHLGGLFHRFMHRLNKKSGQGQNSGAQSSGAEQENCDRKNKEQFNDYLNNVGANIAAFLDPFGIDVSYEVRDTEGESGMKPGGANRGCWRRGGRCGAGWRGRQTDGPSASSEKQTGRTESDRDSQETTGAAGKPSGKENVNDAETSSTWTGRSETQMEAETSGRPAANDLTSTSSSASAPHEEWTILGENGAQGSSLDAPSSLFPSSNHNLSMPASSIFPSAPMPSPSAPGCSTSPPSEEAPRSDASTGLYPDLRIQQSLDQMLLMGFTNKDGWLSRLLIEQRGDIGRTLDIIKSRAAQQLGGLWATQ